MRTWLFLLAGVAFAASAGCATVDEGMETKDHWKTDWNARIDASTSRDDHPCGDFVFDAWADEFQAGCEPGSSTLCDRKIEWLWECSHRCSEWQQYLLRNHFKHVRQDNVPEPDMHVQ